LYSASKWKEYAKMSSRFISLLIDDNEVFLKQFTPFVAASGNIEVIALNSPREAFEVLDSRLIDLIISDIQMPGMNGFEFFSRIKELYPDIPVIFITAFGSTDQAVHLVKQGAFHYFEKPVLDRIELFQATVREALAKRQMLKELSLLQKEKFLRKTPSATIIGESREIKAVLDSVLEIAELPVTVLITGETGTGKELIAHAIHNLSCREESGFLAVNCGAFAEGVLESELFGHEKGSFTGAIARKPGIFELADRGTLFLDEISEASHVLQTKLLRVLETKMVTRVGGTTPIRTDFRIITATNRDLEQEVAAGKFRQDLLYRLNVYPIHIPPLRKRRDDIPLLAEYYIDKFKKRYNRAIEGLSAEAVFFLMDYDWPGNVRELVNVLERAVITCKMPHITPRDIPLAHEGTDWINDANTPYLSLKDGEKLLIQIALKHAEGSKTAAAELLGINRKTLALKMKDYEIDHAPEE
jgi:DNA-binding NtrC family response regulator